MEPVGVRKQGAVPEVEKRIGDLVAGVLAGRRPSREEIVELQADLKALSGSDGRGPARKIAKLKDAVRELAVYAPPPRPPVPVVVPGPRRAVPAKKVAAMPSKREKRIDGLQQRVEALRDEIEAGRRPTPGTFDDIQADLVTFRRKSDGPKVRQMIDDVIALRRKVTPAVRPSGRARATSLRLGRELWGLPTPGASRLAHPAPKRRRGSARGAKPAAPGSEQTRLVDQCRDLRERADRFAAAVPSGRTLPQRESDGLFLHFKLLRPRVDAQTQALNDAAVCRLSAAVEEVRRRASG